MIHWGWLVFMFVAAYLFGWVCCYYGNRIC